MYASTVTVRDLFWFPSPGGKATCSWMLWWTDLWT